MLAAIVGAMLYVGKPRWMVLLVGLFLATMVTEDVARWFYSRPPVVQAVELVERTGRHLRSARWVDALERGELRRWLIGSCALALVVAILAAFFGSG